MIRLRQTSGRKPGHVALSERGRRYMLCAHLTILCLATLLSSCQKQFDLMDIPQVQRTKLVLFQMQKECVYQWNNRPICDGTIIDVSDESFRRGSFQELRGGKTYVAGCLLAMPNGSPVVVGGNIGTLTSMLIDVDRVDQHDVEIMIICISEKGTTLPPVVPAWLEILTNRQAAAKEKNSPKDKIDPKGKASGASDGTKRKQK